MGCRVVAVGAAVSEDNVVAFQEFDALIVRMGMRSLGRVRRLSS